MSKKLPVSQLVSQLSRSVMSDSVRLHGLQPTRFLYLWDSPGKNTGVGCYFLLQYMHVKLLQSCLTLCDSMGSSPPGSPVHRILQARILQWVAISFSRFKLYSLLFSYTREIRLLHGEVLYSSKMFFNKYFCLFIQLLGCARSQLRHVRSSIFTAACRLFSSDMWDLVP